MTFGAYKCTAPDHTWEATKWRKSLLSMANRMHCASFSAVSSRHCATFCFVAAMCIQWLTATKTAEITPERQVRLEVSSQSARQMRQKKYHYSKKISASSQWRKVDVSMHIGIFSHYPCSSIQQTYTWASCTSVKSEDAKQKHVLWNTATCICIYNAYMKYAHVKHAHMKYALMKLVQSVLRHQHLQCTPNADKRINVTKHSLCLCVGMQHAFLHRHVHTTFENFWVHCIQHIVYSKLYTKIMSVKQYSYAFNISPRLGNSTCVLCDGLEVGTCQHCLQSSNHRMIADNDALATALQTHCDLRWHWWTWLLHCCMRQTNYPGAEALLTDQGFLTFVYSDSY